MCTGVHRIKTIVETIEINYPDLEDRPLTFNQLFDIWRNEHYAETIYIPTSSGGSVSQKIGNSNMSEICYSMYDGKTVNDIIQEMVDKNEMV
jgi:hypothetical protein